MTAPLKDRITKHLPNVAPDRARRARERIGAAVFKAWGEGADFLDSVFAAAPYLARTGARHPETLVKLASHSPEALIERLCETARAAATLEDEAEVMAVLRRAKLDLHLVTALADLSGAFSLKQVMAALTDFADAAVQASLACAVRSYGLEVSDPLNPLPGYFVLTLGKHGTRSLNFSSDIDLVIAFESEIITAPEGKDPLKLFSRIAQKLSNILQDVTADGYVFRVDLRLRPDPGSTPVAVSANMARHYFEAVGQNWERAAYAKARVCAGDRSAGEGFLQDLNPFIWRRTMDFAAVEDIRSIAKQIQAVGKRAEVRAAGHDVKLGRGGIREIEVYAQCLQLVFGGRMPAVRAPGTIDALTALAAYDLIESEEAEALTVYYIALRDLEHRIQMLEDEQTQTLPLQDETRRAVAALSGSDNLSDFDARMTALFGAVHAAFSAQFGEGESLATEAGSLVLTGVEPTPDTRETLDRLGFSDPDRVWARLAGWAAGRARAARTERARRLFSRFAPRLIEALSATGDPDAAFTRFSTFFEGLPSGVQPLSLLVNQPELARELIAMLGLAPRLAETLARRPALLDSLLDPAFARPLSEDPPAYRIERFSGLDVMEYERALNAARRLAREEKLRIGGQLLLGRARAQDAGQAYADLADASLGAMAQAAVAEMTARHGPPPGDWAVLGLGKLGGRELSATSDLDIMLVYAPTAEQSDGKRPLGAQTWFIRFTQRLVSALSAPTEEGELYEVDIALRPSGSAGPAAVSLSRFEEYYQTSEAWTWERMALTRARIVVDGGLASRLDDAITAVIHAAGPAEMLRDDAADMRARLERDRPARSFWDIKLRPGGLIDIEFIAQIGQLVSGQRLGADTMGALERLAQARWLAPGDARTLQDAHELYGDLTQILRAAHGADFDPEKASEPFARRLCLAAHCEDLACTADRLDENARRVRAIFERAIGPVRFRATD